MTRRPRPWRLALGATGLGLLLGLATWMVIAQHPRAGFDRDGDALSRAAFEEATGVRLLYIAVTAGGGMLDLRYRVLDPDKALAVHDDENPPTVIDQDSGVALSRPWHEHGDAAMRTGVVYHELLMNSDGAVRRGDRVTLEIGASRLEDVRVY